MSQSGRSRHKRQLSGLLVQLLTDTNRGTPMTIPEKHLHWWLGVSPQRGCVPLPDLLQAIRYNPRTIELLVTGTVGFVSVERGTRVGGLIRGHRSIGQTGVDTAFLANKNIVSEAFTRFLHFCYWYCTNTLWLHIRNDHSKCPPPSPGIRVLVMSDLF